MQLPSVHKKFFISVALFAALAAILYFFYSWLPQDMFGGSGEIQMFAVRSGDGFKKIVQDLREQRLIRSESAFKILALITGNASKLKPGIYEFSRSMSNFKILRLLSETSQKEIEVTIPEGVAIYEIDALLSEKGIVPPGELVQYALRGRLEGKLFPDTYRFFAGSPIEETVNKFLTNFDAKAAPILNKDPERFEENLILASLIQKEVPDFNSQQLVSGVLKKRLNAGVPLQVDATICYIKRQLSPYQGKSCLPITALDLKLDSPYNTYLYSNLPPGPIGSPGESALQAALKPKNSPYWYYLSDPKTGETVFSETLDEHNENKWRYLKNT